MFEVAGFSIKNNHRFITQLGTEESVLRFLNEQKPYSDLKITQKSAPCKTGVDRTEYFISRGSSNGRAID